MLKTYFFKILCVVCSVVFIVGLGNAEEFDDMSIYHLPAQWETHNGDTINLADLKGDVLVVVMIYTSCKAACPVLIGEMKNIEAMVKKKVSDGVKYVLVSIDPKKDTPERLKKISGDYDMTGNQWLFLRSDEETTREFANVLAVKYTRISPLDFSHSNIISVFDRKGRLVHQREGLRVNNQETIDKIVNLASSKTSETK